jgi:hypothetical protein
MTKAYRVGATLGTLLLLAGNSSLAQVQTYCTNITGNIACTSYDHGASSQSYCTSIAGSISCTTYGDNTDRVQVQRNYEAGQVIGTALGNVIVAAIQEYKANKRIRQTKEYEWNQFVQDTIAKAELACEADPKHDTPVAVCRTGVLALNQFIHNHQKDFVPDGTNVKMLADALRATAPADDSLWTEQAFETAFQSIDKKRLDKKIYLGSGHDKNREVW